MHRIIASLLISKRLAYISTNHSSRQYVGDPINIINILSEFGIDELLVIDLEASLTGKLDSHMLRRIRYCADFPVAYSGGISTSENAKVAFACGLDRVLLNSFRTSCNHVGLDVCEHYGRQAVGLSIDYVEKDNLRYIYDASTKQVGSELHSHIKSLRTELFSDLLFTSVSRSGLDSGLDYSLLECDIVTGIDNPIILSGGAQKSDISYIAYHDNLPHKLSAIAASTSIFMYDGFGSTLVCKIPGISRNSL